jgi:phosphate transport system substrate-binding protein
MKDEHMKYFRYGCTLQFLIIGIAVLLSRPGFADPLVIQGATTFDRNIMQPHLEKIMAATGHQITVIPNRTSFGLLALFEGRAHLAMISAPLSSGVAHLKKAMAGLAFDKLQDFEIERTRIGVVVHHKNPVRAINLTEIVDILTGKTTNWASLGGPNMAIRVVVVGGGGGVATAVQSALLNDGDISAPNKIYTRSAIQVTQIVEQEPGALGFAQLTLVRQRDLKQLTVDKPIEQVLSFVTLGEPSPAAKSVIEATRKFVAEAM